MSSLIVLTVLSGLLAISEALPFCKKHNFNGIFQAWINVVKKNTEEEEAEEEEI